MDEQAKVNRKKQEPDQRRAQKRQTTKRNRPAEISKGNENEEGVHFPVNKIELAGNGVQDGVNNHAGYDGPE